MAIGDWMDYQVDVCNADTYYVDLRIAKPNDGSEGRGQIKKGNQVLAAFSVPSTGGWQTWKTISKQVFLRAGQQKLRLYVIEGPWNLNWMEFAKTGSNH